jgi:hypothetical protein
MKTDNFIVFCLNCSGHFKREETYPVKVATKEPLPQGNLYICKGCYEALPVTDEVKRMEVIK